MATSLLSSLELFNPLPLSKEKGKPKMFLGQRKLCQASAHLFSSSGVSQFVSCCCSCRICCLFVWLQLLEFLFTSFALLAKGCLLRGKIWLVFLLLSASGFFLLAVDVVVVFNIAYGSGARIHKDINAMANMKKML